ncbi:MAG: SAM-dependent methyltransferase [Alphaproteobacteria bacterium]|nr:SAM-dependent methyltransferase [Alphaproteobacteria bacterium]
MARGSLVVVGTGIKIANQCTIEARYHIESADIVFEVVGDRLAQSFLLSLNQNVVSLQHLYGRDRARSDTYESMIETILGAVRAGKRVCAAFYGHPGVYVYPSHESVRRAREEGFEAEMLPAVSADACIFADLGFDPGWLGCQSFEATDFVINARKFDPTAVLILWQIALVGDRTLRVFESDPRRIALLAEVLMEDYPADHQVKVYGAATLPIGEPQVQTLPLSRLAEAEITQESTLIVPPVGEAKASPQRLALIEARLAAA